MIILPNSRISVQVLQEHVWALAKRFLPHWCRHLPATSIRGLVNKLLRIDEALAGCRKLEWVHWMSLQSWRAPDLDCEKGDGSDADDTMRLLQVGCNPEVVAQHYPRNYQDGSNGLQDPVEMKPAQMLAISQACTLCISF